MKSDKSQERIETFGYVDFSGLSFIYEDEAHTLERLMEVTGASEESIVRGLEDLKQKWLINIEYENGRIKHVDLSEKGIDFYNSYI